jgi:hypothetical protein
MATVDIDQLESWEKPPDDRYRFVAHIVALGAPDEQSSLAEPRLVWVVEREVSHVVQRIRQRLHRYPPPQRLAWLPHQVGQQELSHREFFRVRLQYLVCLLLAHRLRGLHLAHAFYVFGEVGRERSVDGRIVYGNDVGAGRGVAEGDGHDGFGAHRVPDKRGIFEVVFVKEGFHIFGEGGVSVCLVVGRLAVVAEVEGVDGTREFAGQGTGQKVNPVLLQSGNGIPTCSRCGCFSYSRISRGE